MLKKMIFLSIAVLLMIAGLVLVAIAPYHIYTLTLTEGVSTSFLVMKPSPPVFYGGNEFDFKKDLGLMREDDALFSSFHFSNFLIPLPFNHPVFYFIPNIKIESTGPRLGGSFLDGKNSELFTFMVEKTYKLETISGDQKLFLLPIFKNYISRKNGEEIWRDLFLKKISLPKNIGKNFHESILALKELSYNDLVYNLYILYNRNHLFPANSLRISYDQKTSHGLITIPSKDPKYRLELLLIIDKGTVYSMTIKTKINDSSSENFRVRVLNDTIYKNSTIDSAIPIYAQYKSIPYNKRIDQQGMTYLFSAWSHDLLNREYIRVIILFLERGKSNLKYLKPFYEYAYKKFGSNLSGENDLLLETSDELLKRKMKEELENEVKKEEEINTLKNEGNFSSPDEKIKFYLQKAKEKKTNSDDSEKVLIGD